MTGNYLVYWDDNFHYLDANSVFSSKHSTAEAAIAAAKQIVDEYLESAWEPGITADALYRSFVAFGEDSFVVAPEGSPPVLFSSWHYAKARSEQMASGRVDETRP